MTDFDFPRDSPDRTDGTPPPDHRLVQMPDPHDFDEFPSEAEAATSGAHVEQAEVLTFPVPPAADGPMSMQLVTLGDVLERHGGMEWRQCVALVHQLCSQLKTLPSRSP